MSKKLVKLAFVLSILFMGLVLGLPRTTAAAACGFVCCDDDCTIVMQCFGGGGGRCIGGDCAPMV